MVEVKRLFDQEYCYLIGQNQSKYNPKEQINNGK